MSRVGGRNLAMSWFAGIVCAGVIGTLVWFAIPMGPVLLGFTGDMLRQIAP